MGVIMSVHATASNLAWFTPVGVCLTGVAILGAILPGTDALIPLFAKTVYWILAGTWFLVALTVWDIVQTGDGMQSAWVRHRLALTCSALMVVGMVVANPPRFRVLCDETNLVGASLGLHRRGIYEVPIEATFRGTKMQVLSSEVERRPAGFPFAVAVVHALTGYRPDNAFIVSATAATVALFMFAVLLARWYGRHLALMGLLLLGAWPLFVQWATCGGFELYNLALILALMAVFDSFLITGDERWAGLTLLVAALAAQGRYEAVAVAVPVVLAVVGRLGSTGLTNLMARFGWRTVGIVVAFAPVLWQRLGFADPLQYQVNAGQSATGLATLMTNLQAAIKFFIGISADQGVIPLFAPLALVAAIVVLWRHAKQGGWRTWTQRAWWLLAVIGVANLGQAVAIFGFFWGNLDWPVSIRYALVFLPLAVTAVVAAIHEMCGTDPRRLQPWLAASIALVVCLWPVAARHSDGNRLTLPREFDHVSAWLNREHPARDVIIVSDRPSIYVVRNWSAIGFRKLPERRDWLARMLGGSWWSQVIAVQRCHPDGRPWPGNELPVDLPAREVARYRAAQGELIRISELTWRGLPAPDPASDTPSVAVARTATPTAADPLVTTDGLPPMSALTQSAGSDPIAAPEGRFW